MPYRVIQVQYSGGSESAPTAAVKLVKLDGKEVTDATTGNGPVDAVFKAIQRALGFKLELVDFTVSASSLGSEASGQVVVCIQKNGQAHEGTGLGTDIIVASAEAFVEALNKMEKFEAAVAAHTV
ncbi:MAG: hypothetical protein A3D64_01740 [Candidatus Wildermuthbacteria bacterium RIFCSPHIGHO2_02_FULL_49_9]|uniref:2-isopropylmalate synthase LeuA allosteric (dimerisation) domain-containing protein n=1 Tax=Candidatus Wildermuthbacteria bacterium RIFCSPHIGHO2_02_FULL_49_9 TaxID=1802456 RepID=A0A1G2RCI5_9BACT|nr:MAG: hypothetical protein A3D64_01740 [Candidatus Wildermuthbacteria bacterium RIFCSPHIGHO2_02_FULL_49_9]